MPLVTRSPQPRVVEIEEKDLDTLRMLREQKDEFSRKYQEADEAISSLLHKIANPVVEKADYEIDFDGSRLVVHDGGWKR